MRSFIFILFALIVSTSSAQNDSVFIRQIYNEALSNGNSYEDLRSLCKDIGARITGSAEAAMARSRLFRCGDRGPRALRGGYGQSAGRHRGGSPAEGHPSGDLADCARQF